MKHPFQPLPGELGRARPVIDLIVEGLEIAPQACLLDTGATDIRMGRHVAELAGVDLGSAPSSEIIVGGLRSTGRTAVVHLELRQGRNSHSWSPAVHFCDPWPWAFGLFGLAGLDPFLLTLDSYEEWAKLEPLKHAR